MKKSKRLLPLLPLFHLWGKHWNYYLPLMIKFWKFKHNLESKNSNYPYNKKILINRKLWVGFCIYLCPEQRGSQRGWPCVDKSYVKSEWEKFEDITPEKRESSTGTKASRGIFDCFLTPKCKEATQIDSFWDNWGRLLPNLARFQVPNLLLEANTEPNKTDRVRWIGDIKNWESQAERRRTLPKYLSQ